MDAGIVTDRPSRTPASSRLLDAACLLLLLAGFGYVGFRDLRQPGVYEDEAFAATPAIKLLSGDLETGATQLTAFGRAWPIMRSSYFGPVKIYILAAAFSIFGIHIEVLRATTALLGFAGVVLLFGILRRELGRLPALMSAMLLATDLDYVLATRCDWGPVAFSILAGLAALGALLAWARSPDSRLAPALAGLMMGLGLSHKLDFAACALATTAVFALLYRRRLRGRRAGALVAAAFFLFGAAPALLYGVLTRGEPLRVGRALAATRGNQTFPPAPSQWRRLPGEALDRARTLETLLRGTAIPDWILGAPLEAAARPSRLPAAVAVAPLSFLLLFSPAVGNRWRIMALVWLAGLAIVVLLAIVPMAIGPHHVLLTYPLPHAAAGMALGLSCVLAAGSRRAVTRLLAVPPALVFACIVWGNVLLASAFLREVDRSGAASYWSAEAGNALFETLERHYPRSRIQLLDWGFEHPLSLESRGRLDLRTPYWMLIDHRTSASLIEYSMSSDDVFVAHAPALTVFPAARLRFEERFQGRPDRPLEERFYDKRGQHYCSVFTFPR